MYNDKQVSSEYSEGTKELKIVLVSAQHLFQQVSSHIEMLSYYYTIAPFD